MQPTYCFAVTGTNGKTSITHFLRQIWEALSWSNAILGTFGLVSDTALPSQMQWTRAYFNYVLDALQKEGVHYFIFEYFSYQLMLKNLDDCLLAAVGYTNLTHEHIDLHDDMEQYFAVKLRLFADIASADCKKIINGECPYGQRILDILKYKNCIIYGKSTTYPLYVKDGYLNIYGHPFDVNKLQFFGEFQYLNLLCAIGLAIESGVTIGKLLDILPQLTSPKGRLEKVVHTKDDIQVYIDYAHNPDGLKTVLNLLRTKCAKKLILVFGAPGDYCPENRPLMSQTVNDLADTVIVTNDNPRFENPAKIRAQLMAFCPNAHEISNRYEAIKAAIKMAKPGDIILITGKGHETEMFIGDEVIPFSDHEAVRDIMNAL